MEKISRSRKILYSEFDVIKIAKRAVFIYGYGLNLLATDGVVLIIAKSVQDHPPTNWTLATVNFFGCMIQPLTEKSINVKVIANFDPNIRILPYTVLNWVIRKFAGMLFSKLNEKSKNNDKFAERINEENREFYAHLQESVDEYLYGSQHYLI